MRFGFAVKVLGEPGLKSNDARRWQTGPHLSVSIGYLREILHYLNRVNIRMYRISSDFAPYVTHPEMPQFHNQIDECSEELASVGSLAKEYGIRLSFHPSQYIVLNSPDDRVADLAKEDFHAQARMLDAMGTGRESVIVTHVGGVYGDKAAAIDRFTTRYERLPDAVRRRLVVENDESSYTVEDVLEINRRVGIPVIYDYLHHMNNNATHLQIRDALSRSISTWPEGVTPKIHFSSPRTEMREARQKNTQTGKIEVKFLPPLLSQHSDYLNPYEFVMFLREADGLPDFDVMIEAKSKDLALLRLREQLRAMGIHTGV